MNIIKFNVYGGYESTVLLEDELLTVRADSAGIYLPQVKSFDLVEKGETLAKILDPLTGELISEVISEGSGIVFFAKQDPLVMEHEPLFKIVVKLYK